MAASAQAAQLGRCQQTFASSSRLSRDHEFVEDLKLRDLGTAIEFTDEHVCSPKFMTLFAVACRKMSPLAAFLSSALDLQF